MCRRKAFKYGEKKIYLIFNIDGKNIGQPIILTINVKSKAVEKFRYDFNLSNKDYDDKKLLELLQRHNYQEDEAFSALFNSWWFYIKTFDNYINN